MEDTRMMANRKILYVEDNSANLSLVQKVLAMVDGIEMTAATTGEQGLELARVSPPDLILLDINLPGMNGFEVLQGIRADARLKSIPVIAMTASATRAELADGMRAGFDCYLTKPFDVRRFLVVVEEYLGQNTASGDAGSASRDNSRTG
ncbi:response regulator [Mangrovimicrobium sediminis]